MNPKKIVLCALMLQSIGLMAQDARQRAEIASKSDVQKLTSLSEEFTKEHLKKKEMVEAYAKANNISSDVFNKNGVDYQLVDFDSDGNPIYNQTFNLGVIQTSRAQHLHSNGSLGLNINGQGMVAGVWDSGHPNYSHQEFTGRLYVMDEATTATDHGTHVTGTIMASGVNANAKGVAFQLDEIWVNNWDNDFGEMAAQAALGMTVSNHSYGISPQPQFYGAYIGLARSVDLITNAAPYYVPVIAAGNSRNDNPNPNPGKNGFDLLAGRGVAKNAITVAAVNNVSFYIDASSVTMSAFSSYGPTDDFRVKPDISNQGVNVFSPVNTSTTSYSTTSGTSMATPGVSGVLVLLQQLYNETHGSFMWGSMAKGLILHTADEAGPDPGPDPMFGWGLINARKAAQTILGKGTSSIMEQNTLNNGQTITKQLVAVPGQPLVVSVTWHDPAAPANELGIADISTPVLVNDIDVRLTKDGDTFYPWRLPHVWGETTALNDGDNDRDNIEKIEVPGASGTYTLTITHKGSLAGGSQNYSLIATGVDATLSVVDLDAEGKKLHAWPNPVNDLINFSVDNDVIKNITIINMLGQVVMSPVNFNNYATETSIDVSALKSGVYVALISTDGYSKEVKFVKN